VTASTDAPNLAIIVFVAVIAVILAVLIAVLYHPKFVIASGAVFGLISILLALA
jgi:membrane associated rhomboid family serine protease